MARTERNYILRQDVFYELWNAKANEFKSQKSLQDAAKISKSTMRRVLLGNRVDFHTAQSISSIFNVQITVLFGEVISYERC